MLRFEDAIQIFHSYPVLEERVSGNRYSFHSKQSRQKGKELAREIVRNKDGSFNGYVHSKYMSPKLKQKYTIDNSQMIKIKFFSRDKLHEVIQDALLSINGESFLPGDTQVFIDNKIESSSPISQEKDGNFEELVRSTLYNWLGYGNPNGQVWFIGTEEGGAEIWRQRTKTLEESLQIRSGFHLHMDFKDVWENKYGIHLTTFSGANVWNYMAAFLLNLEGLETNTTSIRNYVFQDKLLGRLNSNHFLCELYPLPKPAKSEIEPYEVIWDSVRKYHHELQPKRLQLITNTIMDYPNVKMMVSYERSLIDLIKKSFDHRFTKLESWKYGKQNYELYRVNLNPQRSILLLSTPFFGQGQISYDGIANCVSHIKNHL